MDRSRFELRTLGPIDLRGPEGEELGALLAQPKRFALLVYLRVAGRGGFIRRDALLALFWPESPADRARGALNKAIYFLRGVLGRETVRSRGDEEVAIDPSRLWCDACAFEDALDQGRLADAISLYRGPFLEAFHSSGSPDLELWETAERERLARRYAEALESLALTAGTEGRHADAAASWRRLLEQDPLSSRVTVGLMESLDAAGDRGAAIVEAERHAERMRAELDAEPEPEVLAVAERLRERPGATAAWRPAPSRVEKALATEAWTSARPAGRAVSRRKFAIAAGLAVVFGMLLFARRAERSPMGAGEAVASDARLTIAVFPFDATDSATALYREGMAHLISVGLDGLGGLHAISSRTILSKWKQSGSAEVADSASAIAVARAAGASHAVLGTVASIGAQVRLTADVFDVETSRHVGRAEASGLPDSLITVAERLSAGVARTVLGEAAPGAHLSALTTTSLVALREYLDGEALYRRSDFTGAIAAYERAVEADSTFALAYYRLGWAHGWAGEDTPKPFSELALHYVDRLPSREASLVRAYYLWLHGPIPRGLDLVRGIVQKWPDDAEGWYLLGEYHRHFGGPLLSRQGEDDRAFAQAVALDPDFAPYHHHYIERAFLDADSARAEARLADYSRAAAGEPFDHAYRIAFALAFGDESSKSSAWMESDTLPTEVLRRASQLLTHGRFLASRTSLLRLTTSRRDVPAQEIGQDMHRLAGALFYQGRFGALEALLNAPELPPGYSVSLVSLLGASALTDGERPAWADVPLGTRDTATWLTAGASAIDQGREADLESTLSALGAAIDAKRAAGDSVDARRFAAVGRALEGYILWKSGRRGEAYPIIEEARREAIGFGFCNVWNPILRRWLGELSLELGHPEDAARYFESLRYDITYPASPYTVYELARARESLGDLRGAVDAYRYVLEAWRDADPELEPRIRHARRAVAVLEAWS